MFEFKLDNNPYDEHVDLFEKSNDIVTLKPGVTVLTGCNGSGKSSFIFILKNYLRHNKIFYFSFDNLDEGGNTSRQSLLDNDDIDSLIIQVKSSEGENIINNVGFRAQAIKRYINDYKVRDFRQMYDNPIEINKRFILLDAVDSGVSIDSIIQIKDFLNFLIEDCNDNNPEIELYIIISTNNYEMTNGMRCLDARTCSEISFESYDDYKDYIMTSYRLKIERYNKINEMAKEK